MPDPKKKIKRSTLQEQLERALVTTDGDIELATQLVLQSYREPPSPGERIKGLASQFDLGVGEYVTGSLAGLGDLGVKTGLLPGSLRPGLEAVKSTREEIRADVPDETGEGTARFLGRVFPEVAGSLVGGAGAVKLGASKAVGALTGDLAASIPVAASDPQESLVGAAGALTGNETLSKLSQNLPTRLASEIVGVTAVNEVLTGLGVAYKHLKTNTKNVVPPDIADAPYRLNEIRDRLNVLNEEVKSATPTTRQALVKERSSLQLEQERINARLVSREELINDLGTTVVDGPPKYRGIRKIMASFYQDGRVLPGLPGFWQDFVDKHKPLEGLAGVTSPLENPLILARNADGFSNHAANTVYFGPFQPGVSKDGIIEPLAAGLHEITETSGDPQALSWYLALMRSKEKKTNLFSRDQATRIEVNATARVKQAAKDFWENRHAHLRLLEAERVIKEGGASRIIQNNNHNYAPSKPVDITGFVSRGAPGVNDPLYKLGKGEDAIIDPLAAAVSQDYLYARLIHRKRLFNAMAKLGDEGHPDIIPLNKAPVREAKKVNESIPDILKDEISDELLEDVTYKGDKGYFRNDGKWYQVPEGMMKALKEVPADDVGAVQQLIRTSGKALRMGVVINPKFQVFNIIKDGILRTVASENVSGIAPIALVQTAGQAFVAAAELTAEALRRAGVPFIPTNDLIHLYEATPGAFSNLSGVTRDRYVRSLRAAEHNVNPSYMSNFKTSMRELNQAISAATGILENTNRYAEFKATRSNHLKQGLTPDKIKQYKMQGLSDDAIDTILEREANEIAAYNAANITVNYRRTGAKLTHGGFKTFKVASTFWNPYLQGLVRTGEVAFRDHPVRTAQFGLTLLTAPAIGIYALNRNNPDWWKLSEEERRNYVHIDISAFAGFLNTPVSNVLAATEDDAVIQNGKSTFLRLPIPHELGLAFVTLPIDFISQFDPKNPYADQGLHKFTDEAFEIIAQQGWQLIPKTVLGDVALSLATNKDSFSGRSIENPLDRTFNVEKTQRGRETSTEVAKLISDLSFNRASPAQADFFIEGMLGPLGREGASLTSNLMGELGLTETGTPPESKLSDAAFLNQFLSTRGGELSKNFYQEYNTLQGRRSNSRSASNAIVPRAGVVVTSGLTQAEESRYKTLRLVNDQIKGLRDYIEFTKAQDDLTGPEKTRRIDLFRGEIDRWLQAALWDEEALPEGASDEQKAIAKLSRLQRALNDPNKLHPRRR